MFAIIYTKSVEWTEIIKSGKTSGCLLQRARKCCGSMLVGFVLFEFLRVDAWDDLELSWPSSHCDNQELLCQRLFGQGLLFYALSITPSQNLPGHCGPSLHVHSERKSSWCVNGQFILKIAAMTSPRRTAHLPSGVECHSRTLCFGCVRAPCPIIHWCLCHCHRALSLALIT